LAIVKPLHTKKKKKKEKLMDHRGQQHFFAKTASNEVEGCCKAYIKTKKEIVTCGELFNTCYSPG